MLIYSMSVSVDGYINDRAGGIAWTAPDDDLFAFHLARVRRIGAHLTGRRLYETMLPWETDPSLRDSALGNDFAEVWSALPKVVFSRSLEEVVGNARLTTESVADEIATTLASTGYDVEIGGAGLAAEAIGAGLVDEFHVFRMPIVLGGGTPYLPPLPNPVPLELVESRTFGSRVVFERYLRAS